MTLKKNPIQGENLGITEEEIKSLQEQQAERKLEIMEDLDKINAPIMATILTGPEYWEYRNLAFWKQLQQKDRKVREMLREFITKKSPRR